MAPRLGTRKKKVSLARSGQPENSTNDGANTTEHPNLLTPSRFMPPLVYRCLQFPPAIILPVSFAEMLMKQAFNINPLKGPSKPVSTAGLGTLGAAHSKYAERYPFASPTPLFKWSNEKRNAKATRGPMETLTISPELKIAYNSSP